MPQRSASGEITRFLSRSIVAHRLLRQRPAAAEDSGDLMQRVFHLGLPLLFLASACGQVENSNLPSNSSAPKQTASPPSAKNTAMLPIATSASSRAGTAMGSVTASWSKSASACARTPIVTPPMRAFRIPMPRTLMRASCVEMANARATKTLKTALPIVSPATMVALAIPMQATRVPTLVLLGIAMRAIRVSTAAGIHASTAVTRVRTAAGTHVSTPAGTRAMTAATTAAGTHA
jgi:hypothetical protein